MSTSQAVNVRKSAVMPTVRSRSQVLRTVTVEELARSTMYIKHPTTYLETLMNMVRVYMGTGLFAMGYAFKNAGILVGSVLTIVLMTAATYCNHVLVNCSEEIKDRREVRESLDLPDIVYYSLQAGPNCCAVCADFFRKLTQMSIIVMQLSVCAVYIVFTGASFKVILESYVDITLDVRIYLMLVTIPILGTALIRELKYLAPLSFVANLLVCLGTAIVYFVISQDLPNLTSRKLFVDYQQYPIFFGTFFFSVSGIGMTMPLRNEMRDPQLFTVWYGVLNVSMLLNGSLMFSIGFLGYLKYGEEIKGSVTLNLVVNNWSTIVVQSAIALSVLLSYALNFYLANAMIWQEINRYIVFIESCFLEGLMTCFLVLLTMGLAIGLPKLGAVIALTGALTTSVLLFFYPQLCDLILRKSYGILWWRFFLNTFLMILAFVAMFSGVYISVLTFVNDEN